MLFCVVKRNGLLLSLDNRRLWALKEAQRQVRVQDPQTLVWVTVKMWTWPSPHFVRDGPSSRMVVVHFGTVRTVSSQSPIMEDTSLYVVFDPPMPRKPSIMLALALVEAKGTVNTRIDTWVSHVTRMGFMFHSRIRLTGECRGCPGCHEPKGKGKKALWIPGHARQIKSPVTGDVLPSQNQRLETPLKRAIEESLAARIPKQPILICLPKMPKKWPWVRLGSGNQPMDKIYGQTGGYCLWACSVWCMAAHLTRWRTTSASKDEGLLLP
jgi:hypothetical protein